MNASKRKGTAFETAVVEYLRGHGFPHAERRALRGARDCGDIAGVVGWCLEAKATREIDLARAVDESLTEAGHARAPFAAAIVKRRNRPTADAYVVMPLSQFAELVADLR